MHRDDCIALTRRLLDRVNSSSSDEAASMQTIDAGVFTDLERWQRERQQFFLDTPQVVGFAGDTAAPGSYTTAECMDTPIVITRDEQGALRAFINACAHRGARVAEGSGSQKRLNCSFHGWSYALDGKLAGRPRDEAFTIATDKCGLSELPVSDACGLLTVGMHGGVTQEQVDQFLQPLEQALSGFAFDKMICIAAQKHEVAANWKLVTNLSHESYHFATLHRESLAPMMTHHAVVDVFAPHSRWAFPMKSITDLNNVDVAKWPDTLPGSINHTVFPGTLVITNGKDCQLIRAEPGKEPGSSTVYFIGGCGDVSRRQASEDTFAFGASIFVQEDLAAAVQCQQGINSGREQVYAGSNEPVVQYWHKQWEDALKK